MKTAVYIFLALVFGIAGGAGAALIGARWIFVSPPRSAEPESVRTVRQEVRIAAIDEMRASMVMFAKPRAGSVRIAPQDAIARGFALTKDGLIFVPGSRKDFSHVTGFSFDRRPFQVRLAAVGKNAMPISIPQGVLIKGYEEDSGDLSLRSVSFFPFEQLEVGQEVVSFNGKGLPVFHRVLQKMYRANPHEVRVSDMVSAMIAIDSAPESGTPVFDLAGR